MKWTSHAFAEEIGANDVTMQRRMRVSGHEPTKGKKWDTRVLCLAFFGDTEAARARKLEADADLSEAKLRRENDEVMPKAEALEKWGGFLRQARGMILASSMPKEDRVGLLKALEAEMMAIGDK